MAVEWHYNWGTDATTKDRLRAEANRLRLPLRECIDIAVHFWLDHIEKSGDDEWMPK